MTRQENNGTIATVATGKTFTDLLVDYVVHYETDPQGKDFTETLTTIAKIITHSVLRKCINVSHNESLIEVKRDIVRDSHSLETIARANNELYTLAYTKDGDLTRKEQTVEYIVKKDKNGKEKKVKKENSLEIGYNRETRERLGDGLDLVNVAIATLLEQTREHGAWLEQGYEVRRLKRKVYIKLEDSVNGWETVITTPIQETFKAVRRAIENSRAMSTDPRNGYSYLEDIATDSETGEETTVYRRLDKYADLGGYAVDSSGKRTLYSASEETTESMDKLVESLNLTDRQATVLKLRLRGYGQKAIATYLGVSKQAIQKTQKQIQSKVIAIASEEHSLFTIETIERYMK